MKTKLLISFLISSSLMAQNCSYIDNLMPKDYQAKDLDCLMIISQKDQSKLIPQKIDDMTTLDSANYNRTSKTYESSYILYENINKVSEQDWKTTSKFVKKSIINENCNIPNLRLFFKYGLTAKHIYKDKNKKDKFTVLINNEVCEKL